MNPDRIAELVRTVPGVADLHGGVFGEVATYADGRRVAGVRLGGGGHGPRVEIHLTAVYPADLPALADAVRARVAPHVDGPVDVVVQDVVASGTDIVASGTDAGASDTDAFREPDSARKQVPS